MIVCKGLVMSFGQYVEATTLMIEALDDTNIQVNQDLFDQANYLQGEATKGIVQAIQQMAKKLGIGYSVCILRDAFFLCLKNLKERTMM